MVSSPDPPDHAEAASCSGLDCALSHARMRRRIPGAVRARTATRPRACRLKESGTLLDHIKSTQDSTIARPAFSRSARRERQPPQRRKAPAREEDMSWLRTRSGALALASALGLAALHPFEPAHADNYPTRPDHHHRVVRGGHRDGHAGAPLCRQAVAEPRPADGHRQSARRRRRRRRRKHPQGRARRLHARGGDQRHHVDPADAVQAAAVQPADRLRADLQLRKIAVRVHRQSRRCRSQPSPNSSSTPRSGRDRSATARRASAGRRT